mgnify:CR=1 FL=1
MLIYNQMLVWHNNIKHTINLERVSKMKDLECIHNNCKMQNTSFCVWMWVETAWEESSCQKNEK